MDNPTVPHDGPDTITPENKATRKQAFGDKLRSARIALSTK
jgi:hypothetical protein